MSQTSADQFRDAIRSAGLEPPDLIEADGKLRRFASNGKRGDAAGWYVLHGDGIPAGAFGDWRTGISESWRADVGRTLTPQEEAEYRAKVEATRREREADEKRSRAEAKAKAAAIWKESQPTPEDHPYLIRKRVKPHGVRSNDGALVIPMRDGGGEIHSLQFIAPDGEKRFLAGGRVAGCFLMIGEPRGAPLCIAEGFATAATIHDAIGYAVAVAFNAGNLEPVARALRGNFADVELILCADDDVYTAGNPGLTKAKAAALTIGGKLAVPDFGADRPAGMSDFNDMAAHCGIEAVKRQIEAATAEGSTTNADPITAILEAAGIAALQADASMAAVEEAVRALATILAGADEIRRATVREATLKKLDEVGISAPGRLLDAAMPKVGHDDGQGAGQTLFLADPEPWKNPVDGAELLDGFTTLIQRYVVLSPEAAHTVALWILHAWALNAFDNSPLLCITSPIKRCGKTTLLEIVSSLSPRKISASNITAAVLFRIIEKFLPTLLVDEADSFLGDNNELRGIINSGHRRSSAFVVRCVGDDHEPRQFSTWGPKAIALIGKLPATLEDRSLVIAMRRRAPDEPIKLFRSSDCEAAAEPLGRKAFRWASDNLTALRAIDPEMPSELNDRAADNWRPLVSIAELAGGEWPTRARAAALGLSKDTDEADGSALIELLIELREVFQSRDRIPSAELAEHLGAKPESRWSEWSHGKQITQRQVARLLAPLKIKPSSIRVGTETPRGYLREWFDDAFLRYIPLPIRNTATSEQNQPAAPENDPQQNGNVADRKSDLSTRENYDVADVADRSTDSWEDIA
jgi:putative DNA primase/helicase